MTEETTSTVKKWPAEATEENFREQAEAVDKFLKAEGEKDPTAECKNLTEFVDTMHHLDNDGKRLGVSGTARIHARMLLRENGFNALATEDGAKWLTENH